MSKKTSKSSSISIFKGERNLLGSWAFLIGIILAIIFGFFGPVNSTLALILVLIGLIVGSLNVVEEETQPFLISGAILVIVSSFGAEVLRVVPSLGGILEALLVIFVPATIIVAIKHVFTMARD